MPCRFSSGTAIIMPCGKLLSGPPPDNRPNRWGGHQIPLHARRNAWWDANKIGLGPPSLETAEGWLMLYQRCASNWRWVCVAP